MGKTENIVVRAGMLALLAGLPLHAIEQKHIERAIKACGGSIPKAAVRLGVSASTLYRKKQAWTADS